MHGFIKDITSNLKSIGLSTFVGKCNIFQKKLQFCVNYEISVFDIPEVPQSPDARLS